MHVAVYHKLHFRQLSAFWLTDAHTLKVREQISFDILLLAVAVGTDFFRGKAYLKVVPAW